MKRPVFIHKFTLFLYVLFLLSVNLRLSAEAENAPLIVKGDHYYPPYEFIDDNGEPAGYNVDMFRAVSEVMDLEARIELGPWENVREELEQGSIDVLTGMYYSEERDRLVDFSQPHILVTHAIFVREGSEIRSLEDVRGKALIIQSGDIMHDYAVSHEITENIVPVENQIDALVLLSSGRYDCALLARLQGLYLAEEQGLENLEAYEVGIEPQKYCFGVREGASDLVAKLNDGLRILQRTGREEEIYNK